MHGEQAGEPRETLHRCITPDQRANRRRHPAAAIGVDHDILGEHRAQRGEVAGPRRREEGIGEPQAVFIADHESRPGIVDMRAGAAGELAAGRGLAADRLGDRIELHPEHVMQQEGRPFQRRQPLQRDHQRQDQVVGGLLLLGIEERLGQPWSDIGRAPAPRGFQLVQR